MQIHRKYRFLRSIFSFLKKDPVLLVAAGAAIISAFFVPPSPAYLAAIDFRVLALLFCLMAVIAGFQQSGLFAALARRLLSGQKTLRLLIWILVMLPFFSSMLVTNDVALLTFVPFGILILHTIEKKRLLVFVTVLQTVAANLGSMLTPVGNPQNLFLYGRFELTPLPFFRAVLPFVLLSFFALSAASLCTGGESVQVSFSEQEHFSPRQCLLFSALFALSLLSVFRVLPYPVPLAVIFLYAALFNRPLLRRVDYGLLLTFVCFFLFSGNIGGLPAVRAALAAAMEQSSLSVSVLCSQVISNVPAAVLLSNFTSDWHGLLLGVNIGGLGTPIASLASLISLKFYLREEPRGLGRYLLFFTAINLLGLFLLVLLSALL